MLDKFAKVPISARAPASDGFAIAPHDVNELAEATRAIYVGTGGNIAVVLINGDALTFKNAAAGSILPIRCKAVKATGTTAADLIGLL